MDKTTDFGFSEIPTEEKSRRVAEVFNSVASRYDLMNDLMSMGIHRLWKRFTITTAQLRPGQRVLDLAGGTGDLAALIARQVGAEGQVVLADINEAMLQHGRTRLLDMGFAGNIEYVQANAESLPFAENHFHCITMAFGLRNVTNKEAALKSAHRVLKPGGRFLVLEFSKPAVGFLEKLYDAYSFNIIPKLGRWITGDADSYQYLVESIRKHPDQKTLQAMFEQSGFKRTRYLNLSGGIVALHSGYKF